MSVTDHLIEYARRIRELRRANPDVPETAMAPAFQTLLERLTVEVPAGRGLTIVPEFRERGVGRPDVALVHAGAPPRSFVELKAPAKSADPARWRGHDHLQFERFSDLACWAACNFGEIRLLERAEEVGSAQVVPDRCLRPDRQDAKADQEIAKLDVAPLMALVERLFQAAGNPPSPENAEELATMMAHSARLVRGTVQDRLADLTARAQSDQPLLQVWREFREVLYAHPEAGGYASDDFDALFSAAFAQTLAFGLLLVREATGKDVKDDAWQLMPEEHPLMRTALRVLSQPEVVNDIGIGFAVLRDTVNSFAPELLAPPSGGRDPILYFYEDFLKTFDPQARQRFGVYYTPVEVVRYMVGALDRVLRENLHTPGLADPNVTILDPATGTGTFLIGIADKIRREQIQLGGAGKGALVLLDLARRMFGFELLVGPYAVAHYRLHHALRRPLQEVEDARELVLPRLGVYLTDTLAEPGADAPAGRLGFVAEGIAEERREANRIKSEQPILAIIGNPPYRRLEEGENRTLVGDWMDTLWDDLKLPVREAGQGNQLNTFPELSVAFWRWAIWKLFEAENAPRKGVIAFISNRKILTGWPYAGLRQMMRRHFDRIEIIDLRGDVRRGERAGVEADQGVFNIQVGTAITVAIADGSRADDGLADVYYTDSWIEGLFARRAKLEWLDAGAQSGRLEGAVQVARAALDDMRPAPFMNGEWLPLTDCFGFRSSGLESKRDGVVYAPTSELLEHSVRRVMSAPVTSGDELFNSTGMNTASKAVSAGYSREHVQLAGYRPLDLRCHYNHPNWNDRPRPNLRAAWGAKNICLFSLPSGTGAGPAIWCHAAYPDRHAFRGSYGGYAFPLYDRRAEVNAPNLSSALLERLGAAYGEAVAAEDTFDAILCLLSASSYTLRFAEDLEDVFPHVPFPHRPNDFREAARVGARIREVETFARPPEGAFDDAGFVRIESNPGGELAEIEYAGGEIALCADGSGRVTGLPEQVWNFSVSGYRVLPRWLEARRGLLVDLALANDFRDICGRIAELLELFDQADIVLERTLNDPLSREALGLDADTRDAHV